MRPPRPRIPQRSRVLLGVVLALTGVAALVLSPVGAGPSGTAAGADGPASHAGRTIRSRAYGYSLPLPDGWRRARHRLVPHLLDPLEILSLATFPMPVGGGGDCGRDPITAIERMGSGDALITIQEEGETPGMRRELRRRRVPSLPRALARMRLRRELHPPGEQVPASQELWYAQVDFTSQGRWLDALLWVKGTPGAGRVRQVKAILASIDFERGMFVRFSRRPTTAT